MTPYDNLNFTFRDTADSYFPYLRHDPIQLQIESPKPRPVVLELI